jgi:hypothetical protein
MQELNQLLPFLIPVLLLDLAMKVIALIDLVRRERANGPKWLWALIILFVNLLGPIIYFVLGRRE